MKQVYVDLLKKEYAGKSTQELRFMLAKPSNSEHVRDAIQSLLEERGALPDDGRLGIFLVLWPWLPLLTFLVPNFMGWVFVYFVMIWYPVGVIYAFLGAVYSLACLSEKRYYRLAIASGAIGTVAWYWLYSAAQSGAIGIKT